MRRLSAQLLFFGIAGWVLALGKAHASLIGDYDFSESSRYSWSCLYIALLAVSAYSAGLPDLAGHRSSLGASVSAAGAAAVAISVLQVLTGSAQLPRYVVLGSVLVLVPWFLLCVAIAHGGRSHAESRDRVLAVVSQDEADALRRDLAAAPERRASIQAAITAEEAAAADGRLPLLEVADEARPTVVVLDREAQADESVVAQAATLHERGVRIRTLTLFYDHWLGKLPISELERVGLMFDIGELHKARYGRIKRLVDLLIAGPGAIVLAALLPILVLLNAAANRGPLFYRQPRVGKNGREFEILKLRSIRPDSSTGEWLEADDPRVTPLGRILRRSHLDELPQVVNVLVGDLSMVGPRPEQPKYVTELRQKVPFYDFRHQVRPGLTGWAQVKYPYGATEASALEKLQYEFFYLRHQSLGLDLRILARTIRSIVRLEGR